MLVLASVSLVLLSLAFYVWYTFIRVPEHLRGLPVVPGLGAKPSARRQVAAELAKTHPLARSWFFQWTLFVLHPEYAKIVENNATLFEKEDGARFPKFSFLTQFLGQPNVVNVQTEDWKRHRAVINPAFDFAYIRSFTSIFSEVGLYSYLK